MAPPPYLVYVPPVGCSVVTAAAFAAAGAWRQRRARGAGGGGPSAARQVGAPAALALAVVAVVVLVTSAGATGPATDVHASATAADALAQLATNAALAAPFVAWAWWTRKGAGVLGIGSADAGAALAVGLGVAFACIAMLGRWSTAFWSVPGTWWALAAMLGVGVSEELVFRGCLLGGLARRLSRARAEWWSAAGFAVFHLPHHLAIGMPPGDIAVSLALLLVWGWCYAFAMRTGRHVPGLALVHAITNVCGET